jgi:hypothetical protein
VACARLESMDMDKPSIPGRDGPELTISLRSCTPRKPASLETEAGWPGPRSRVMGSVQQEKAASALHSHSGLWVGPSYLSEPTVDTVPRAVSVWLWRVPTEGLSESLGSQWGQRLQQPPVQT